MPTNTSSFYEASPAQTVGQQPLRTAAPQQPQKLPVFLIVLAGILIPCLLAYYLVTGNENMVFAFVLAALGGLVIIGRPFWGLVLFIGLLYTRPEENIPALAGARLPLLISAVTAVALTFQKLLNRESIVKTPMNGMIIGFGLAAIASSFVSGTTSTAVIDMARLVILVFLILNLACSPDRYNALITTIIILAAYVAGVTVYMYQTGNTVLQDGVLRPKASGIFSDPNDLASTIVAGLGLLLPRLPKSSKKAKSLYVPLLGMMLWATVLTNSRGGTLALAAILIFFTLASVRNKRTAIVVAAVAVLGMFVVLGGRMTNFDSGESSANSRFWFWANAVDQLIAHPLFGVGYGGFPDVNGAMTAHNSWALCFAETGLVGYYFWMGIIYYAFKRSGASGAVADNDQDDRMRALAPRLALTGYLAASFWLSHTYSPILYVLLPLPVVEALSTTGSLSLKPLPQCPSRWRERNIVLWISLISIVLIYLLANRMK
jgi:O-antigen ligase